MRLFFSVCYHLSCFDLMATPLIYFVVTKTSDLQHELSDDVFPLHTLNKMNLLNQKLRVLLVKIHLVSFSLSYLPTVEFYVLLLLNAEIIGYTIMPS